MITILVPIKPESSFMYQLKAVWWSFNCYVICIILGHSDFSAVIYDTTNFEMYTSIVA